MFRGAVEETPEYPLEIRLVEEESVVAHGGIPAAIGEGQFPASGQLARVNDQRMTRLYPVLLSIPEEFPVELRRVGVAASVRIHTEKAGVVGVVATILQWVETSLDLIL